MGRIESVLFYATSFCFWNMALPRDSYLWCLPSNIHAFLAKSWYKMRADILNKQTQPKYLCIVSNLIYYRLSWSIKRDSKDCSGLVFKSVSKCINLVRNAWKLCKMPTEYANRGKLESLNAARKETKPIFYLHS